MYKKRTEHISLSPDTHGHLYQNFFFVKQNSNRKTQYYSIVIYKIITKYRLNSTINLICPINKLQKYKIYLISLSAISYRKNTKRECEYPYKYLLLFHTNTINAQYKFSD